MRKISNFKNDDLREDQFSVLLDVFSEIKNKSDLEEFFRKFMTESELAYLGQRLNIMRMLLKNFSYQEIADKLNVPSNTICRIKVQFDAGGQNLKKVISQYKYKPQKNKIIVDESNGFVHASYPGVIRKIKK